MLKFIFSIVLINWLIVLYSYIYLKKYEYTPPIPLSPSRTFKLILFLKKIQKDTNNNLLKSLIIMLYLSYFLIIMFLLIFALN